MEICYICGKPLDDKHEMHYPPPRDFPRRVSPVAPPYIPPNTPEDKVGDLPSVVEWRRRLRAFLDSGARVDE